MTATTRLIALCLSVVLALFHASAQARELGEMDGRWMFIASSSNGTEAFVDPTSIVFDREVDAWACWVRVLDPLRSEESIDRHLYRSSGERFAVVSSVTYDTRSRRVKSSFESQVPLKWHAVIPDSFGENVWAAIKIKSSQK